MNRDFLKLLLLLAMLLLGLLALWGCRAPTFEAPWQKADESAEHIGHRVSAAATQVSGSAAQIVATAREGHEATPEPLRPRLDPFWSRILAHGQVLVAQGDALATVRQDIDALREQVQAGQRELTGTKAALEAEKAGRAKDNKAWQTKLEKANGQWERMFRTIAWLAIAAIGISVTVGVLMHDFRISIAGGAGGLAVVIACMVVGQILAWLPWIAGGLLAVIALWVLIETLVRGSFAEAIRTTPAQDLRDLSSRRRVPPAASSAVPVSSVPVTS